MKCLTRMAGQAMTARAAPLIDPVLPDRTVGETEPTAPKNVPPMTKRHDFGEHSTVSPPQCRMI